MDFAVIPVEKITAALLRAEKAGAQDIDAASRAAAAELGIPVESVLGVVLTPVQGEA
ncbi:hypothetical protein ACEN9J_02810 [Variovorax sp. Varisp41]|jgi:hypothetical protein|uniref:hypothetical protein n=1 Tax=Variovorax sp. Varisp41 TaxID=3243033 RepID=UPI0039B42ED4